MYSSLCLRNGKIRSPLNPKSVKSRSVKSRDDCIAFGLYGIHSSARCLTREETDLSSHTNASEGGRESNQYLAYSRWDELGPPQLGMEDNTVNLIGVQKGLVDI